MVFISVAHETTTTTIMQQKTLAVAYTRATCSALCMFYAAVMNLRTKQTYEIKKPKLRRTAIMRPIVGKRATAWERLLSFRTSEDIVASTNSTRSGLIDWILPLKTTERATKASLNNKENDIYLLIDGRRASEKE